MKYLDSANRIRDAIGDTRDLTFVTCGGNLGDELIWSGTRLLLTGHWAYRELRASEAAQAEGDVLVIAGSGGWCQAHHAMPGILERLEPRFRRVVVLPSSYDPAVPEVRQALTRSRALFFARERRSFELIQPFCQSALEHDCAVHADYTLCRRIVGKGTLYAYRTDRERVPHGIPTGNRDISLRRIGGTLGQWLRTIAVHECVYTDRAHVMLAAALLGKRVIYTDSNYHKLRGIAEFSLSDLDVTHGHAPV